MIYTVTLNPAIDKTVVIPGFSPGNVNRIRSVRVDAGGKGVNISKCLHSLGLKSTACMLLSGSAGEQLLSMVEALGIETLSATVPGQTRTNLKIIDPDNKENTDINEPGPTVDAATLLALRDRLGARIHAGDIVILSGSLPKGADPDLYQRWIAYFKTLGAAVFLDAEGQPLRLGLQAQPYLVKPNGVELSGVVGKPLSTREELLSAGSALVKGGIREAVISMGADGALFLSEEGAYAADALPVPVQSTVGAGDSMVAAMAYGLEKKLPRDRQIRLAVAMGAASVMCDGSQAPDADLVWQMAEKVELRQI